VLPGDFQLRKPSRKQALLFGVLGIGALFCFAVTAAVGFWVVTAWFGIPPTVAGFRDGPDQPIAFPHTTHADTLGMDCLFCHRTAAYAPNASVPAEGLCMTCHKTVGDNLPEIEKLRDYHTNSLPIDWVRVHRVPDHVKFEHSPHVQFFSGTRTVVDGAPTAPGQVRIEQAQAMDANAQAGQTLDFEQSSTCAICHGDVASMVKVKQVRSLKMADCVDCHRDNSFVDPITNRLYAPAECVTCHY